MAAIGEIYTQGTFCEFEWRITDFDLISKKANENSFGRRFWRSDVSIAGSSWNMGICPNGNTITNTVGYIDLYLLRTTKFPPISLEVSFGIKTADGEKVLEKKSRRIANKDRIEFYITLCIISRAELLKKKSELLPDNTLTVLCTVKYSKSTAGNESLSDDLKKMLSDGKNHDLILKVRDKELRAHQDILRARCHVFESMLDHDMKEKKSGVVDVSDCDPDVMELFLTYVYSGEVEALDETNMLGLYYVADKYDMQSLKRKCCDFIKKSLSVTNICEVIQLAVNHSDSGLLEYATEYFMENALDIMVTVKWQTFLKENSTLGNELLIKSIQKLKNVKC